MDRRALFAAPGLAALLALAACNQPAGPSAEPGSDRTEASATDPAAASRIAVNGGWSRATAPGQEVGGGFLTVTNQGEGADRLIGGSSPAAGEVQIHSMSMDGGVMRMRSLGEGLEIPAEGTVTLAPGGVHLMLMGLKAPLAEGSKVPLTLEFEKAGKVETVLEVRAAGTEAPGAPEEHKHG